MAKVGSIELEVKDGQVGGPSRDLKAAKAAYENKDAAASRAAHDVKKGSAGSAPEKHGGTGSEYIKSLVFGGLDGIITTFAVVCASYGGGLSVEVILLMGFANLIADGISMGFGDYLSEKAELDFTKKEMAREEWELKEYPEGEVQEMVELYVEKGMPEEDATAIMQIYSKHKKMFVDLMMVQELGLMPPDGDEAPWKNGMVTFFAFLLFGSIPLWFYLGFHINEYKNNDIMFGCSTGATALALFLLGVTKAGFTKQNPFVSGVSMLTNGAIAAAGAYFTGWGMEEALGISDVCA